MTNAEAGVGQRWKRRAAGYDMAVAGLLLLAAATGWSDLVLLVSGSVVPGWALCVVLLCAAAVLSGVRAVRVRSGAGRTGMPSRPLPVRAVRGVALVAAVLSCAAGALDELGAEYYVLHPTGPGGCTAVVRETSFLVIGSGDVYAIGPSHIGWGPSGSWIADDGYRPVARGAYELRWNGRGGRGTIQVHGTETDPIVSGGSASLDCGG